MEAVRSIKLQKIIEDFDLEVLVEAEGYRDYPITTEDVNRPALQLAGYFDYFDQERIQTIGRVENTYLADLSHEQRKKSFDDLFSREIPALILTRGLEPFQECLDAAKKYGRVLLRTQKKTSDFMSSLIIYLQQELAPRITRHGVLLDIYGEGVLLMGESGVGKSETAIELVQRGHRLIADDAVEIRRLTANRLEGTSPELIRYYIELRGIGIVDVRRLFGMSAVKKETDIDMVINLEPWKDNAMFDRLGAEEQYTTILDVQVPCLNIPVKPGRNLAVIVEVAAMNNRNKKMGYNAALEFTRKLDAHFEMALAEQENQNNF